MVTTYNYILGDIPALLLLCYSYMNDQSANMVLVGGVNLRLQAHPGWDWLHLMTHFYSSS